MSMLKEILEKMYIDPELLEALGEEQKQMLFIKMREEQLKRWHANEEKLEKENGRKPVAENNKRRVQWLTGNDGNVWVWVMGEHATDKTIEQIIEDEEKAKARQLAEKEVLMDGVQDSNDGSSFTLSDTSLDEQALKNQLSQMKVSPASTGIYDNNQLRGVESVECYNPRATASYTPFAAFEQNRDNNSNIELQNGNSRSAPAKPRVGPPLPAKPSKFATTNSQTNWTPSTPQTSMTNDSPRISTNDTTTSKNSNFYRAPTNTNQLSNPELPVVQMRMNGGRNQRNVVDEEINKRQSEIFEQMQEKRERLQREAEREIERQRLAWEDQERKAREAEAQIREIAMKAREQHRKQSLRTSTSILPALKDSNATSLRDAIKNLPRPPRPPSRKAIVDWFKKEELPRGTGLDPRTKQPALWFHGIISRDDAENLLTNKPSGSFLVRVSERIWGYTVSYVVGDGSSKHFLIEKIADGYQFLGTNQVVHSNLYDLITYHETAPITSKGKEILKWAVGQLSSAPDYTELLESVASNVPRYTYNSRF
uniref:SH2 domain-containing protein n=1 Tax=Steinernema glaseri TaxID=37863 RepID=A0A1I7Z6G7_9BILA